MCQTHWIALSVVGDNCLDCLHWGFDCFDGFVYLVCNNQPFDFVAVSLCVVMNTIDQRMTTVVVVAVGAAAVVVVVGDYVCHHS